MAYYNYTPSHSFMPQTQRIGQFHDSPANWLDDNPDGPSIPDFPDYPTPPQTPPAPPGGSNPSAPPSERPTDPGMRSKIITDQEAEDRKNKPAGPAYNPPPMISSPFILPNGQIPPGMPFSPNLPMQGLQDNVLRNMLTNPIYGPEQINMMNEQQKELALQRGQQQQEGIAQSAARRGTMGGNYLQGQQRRAGDQTTQQLLQSNRDVNLQTTQANREGFLDALGASEGILGPREDRGLNVARFAELIREYDNDLANRQSEFGSNMGFNYNNLNAQMMQAFIRAMLAGGY